ncbi:MAG: class I SAM-dependent methyltransferase [Myxococcales bacterium]|nr:class I SAM-dependent methyltransferase [Myxococcales bacterium]
MLCCPRCLRLLPVGKGEQGAGRDLLGADRIACATEGCGGRWDLGHGIPDLYLAAPERGEDVAATERVRLFYEARPFPDYRDTDDLGALVRRGRANPFTRALDDEIPPRANVVEVGCGAGQMGLFLSVAGRQVLGLDLTWASLGLADAFRRAAGLLTVTLARANVFRLPLATGSVDVAIFNGVIHHTANPRAVFAELARVGRPGGYVVLGLYNRYGRALLPPLGPKHARSAGAGAGCAVVVTGWGRRALGHRGSQAAVKA